MTSMGMKGRDPLGKVAPRRKRKPEADGEGSENDKFEGALEYGKAGNKPDTTVKRNVPRSRWVPDRSRRLPPGSAGLLGGLLATSQFVTLQSDRMMACARAYDTDPLLMIVTTIMRSSILGGGLDIQRKGFTLTASARAFYQRVWSEFITRLLRSLWAFGFAAVVTEPHPIYKAIPHVLEVERLLVRMQGDIYGLRRYVFHVRETDMLLGMGTNANGQRLEQGHLQEAVPNVLIFEMNPPAQDGSIQSRVSALLPALAYYTSLQQADMRAVDLLTNPYLVSAVNKEPYDTQNVAMGANPTMIDSAGAGMYASVPLRPATREDMIRRKSVLRLVDRMNGRPPRGNETGGGVQILPVQELREGTTAVSAPQAVEPQYLIQTCVQLEERVGAMFGVPRSLFSHYSGGTRVGGDSQRLVFLESSRNLKTILLPILTATFAAIYASDFWDDTLVIALNDNVSLTDAIAVCQVSWNLPGMPPPSVMQDLWRCGVLKYSFYTNSLTHIYGLPAEALEPFPRLSLKELAGIPPPAPAAPGAKGSKPKAGKAGKGLKPPGKSAVRAPFGDNDPEALERLRADKSAGDL